MWSVILWIASPFKVKTLIESALHLMGWPSTFWVKVKHWPSYSLRHFALSPARPLFSNSQKSERKENTIRSTFLGADLIVIRFSWRRLLKLFSRTPVTLHFVYFSDANTNNIGSEYVDMLLISLKTLTSFCIYESRVDSNIILCVPGRKINTIWTPARSYVGGGD